MSCLVYISCTPPPSVGIGGRVHRTLQNRMMTCAGCRSPVPTKIGRVNHGSSGANVSNVGNRAGGDEIRIPDFTGGELLLHLEGRVAYPCGLNVGDLTRSV